MNPASSGVLSSYTSVEPWFFAESYQMFNTNKEELFKVVDGKDGEITYYMKTTFLANQE